jgi:hypothetical protein
LLLEGKLLRRVQHFKDYRTVAEGLEGFDQRNEHHPQVQDRFRPYHEAKTRHHPSLSQAKDQIGRGEGDD